MSPIKKQRVYRRPDPTLATGMFREYRPRISCFHTWEPVGVIDFEDTGLAAPGFDEVCFKCAAACKRDPRGRIVEYSTLAERELEVTERVEVVS